MQSSNSLQSDLSPNLHFQQHSWHGWQMNLSQIIAPHGDVFPHRKQVYSIV
jgi:hypothetical protein